MIVSKLQETLQGLNAIVLVGAGEGDDGRAKSGEGDGFAAP